VAKALQRQERLLLSMRAERVSRGGFSVQQTAGSVKEGSYLERNGY
jgi:hypothetical protein